jgi:arginyl-tRNA synthetase
VIALLEQALAGLAAPGRAVVLERTKAEAHGDVACNVALQVAKGLKRNSREEAAEIADALRVNPASHGLIEEVEIAGPGFINLRIAPAPSSRWCARSCANGSASARPASTPAKR